MTLDYIEITKKDVKKIDERHNQLRNNGSEVITGNKIYIRTDRFACEKCGNSAMDRTLQHGSTQKVRFVCHNCKHESTHVFDRKQGVSVKFQEYSEITNKMDKKL